MINGYSQRYTHLLNRDSFEIYFLLIFRALGFSMVGIFMPLYLFVEKSYSLNQVILFYIIMSIFFALSSFLAIKVLSQFGAKHSMVGSYLFLITGFILFVLVDKWEFMYLLSALFQGLSFGFFWMGFHIDAVKHFKKKELGKRVGLISFSSVIGSVIGPIIGGVILKFLGFNVLFIIAMLLFIISVIPLMFSKEIFAKAQFDLKVLWKKEYIKYFFGYFVQGIKYTVAGIFWPIFIFTILGSYLSLGWYATIVTLLVGIMSYIFGLIADGYGRSFLIRIFAPFEALFWILRIFVYNPWTVFAIGGLANIASSGIDIPLLAKTYKHKSEIEEFIFFREVTLRIGEIFGLMFVFIVGSITASFVLTGVASLLYLLF